MKPTKRMQRRWAQFMPEDVQILADSVTPEKYTYTALGNGDYMPEFSEKLIGKTFQFLMDAGDTYQYEFTDKFAVRWSKNNGKVKEEFVQVLELPDADGIFLFQHYCKGSVPPTAHIFVLDINTGLVTLCLAHAGSSVSAREIEREFYFGICSGYEDKGVRHSFTEDLVGTAIYWTYFENPKLRIKHIYSAPLFYTYQMVNISNSEECWVASNPANYLKITDHVYVFTFLEERQAGTQGFFLINMETLHDVGSFFGIHAQGMECCMFGAKGELTSPFAFDWCETKQE